MKVGSQDKEDKEEEALPKKTYRSPLKPIREEITLKEITLGIQMSIENSLVKKMNSLIQKSPGKEIPFCIKEGRGYQPYNS